MRIYLHSLERYLEGLTGREWIVVLVFSVGIGILCMRGLGSRKHY